MKSRDQKLASLKSRADKKQESDNDLTQKLFEEKISEFKDLFGKGVDLNAQDLIDQLKEIEQFSIIIERLSDTLHELSIPDVVDVNCPEDIKLSGIDEFVDVIKTQNKLLKEVNIPHEVKLASGDLEKSFKEHGKLLSEVNIPEKIGIDGLPKLVKLIDKYIDQINKLEKAIGSEKAIKIDFSGDEGIKKITDSIDKLSRVVKDQTPGQEAGDFLPIRRVRSIGNRLVFDDSTWGGVSSGGGSGIIAYSENGRAQDVSADKPLPVDIQDTSVVITEGSVSTSTDVSLASSASSQQLLATNSNRKGLLLNNTDANGVYLYYGTTATTSKFSVLIPSGAYWEMPKPIYTGRIDVIWAADGSGSLIGSEL